MFASIKKAIKDMLTENDNSTYCLARVAAALAIIAFMAGTAYDMSIHHSFMYTNFANGIMQILGGGGAMIGMKQFTSGTKQ